MCVKSAVSALEYSKYPIAFKCFELSMLAFSNLSLDYSSEQ